MAPKLYVAEAWDENLCVRRSVRESNSVFGGEDLPHANVKQAGRFREVLAPLLKAMASARIQDKIPLFSVHQVELQYLV